MTNKIDFGLVDRELSPSCLLIVFYVEALFNEEESVQYNLFNCPPPLTGPEIQYLGSAIFIIWSA